MEHKPEIWKPRDDRGMTRDASRENVPVGEHSALLAGASPVGIEQLSGEDSLHLAYRTFWSWSRECLA